MIVIGPAYRLCDLPARKLKNIFPGLTHPRLYPTILIMADTSIGPAPFTFKKRATKATARKRAATPPPAETDSDSGFESSEDEQGRQIKRRKKNTGVTASSTSNVISRPNEPELQDAPQAVISNSENATKTSNWYDEDQDGNAVKKPGTKRKARD